MDRDAHVHDNRDARDVRAVLPRLSDRSDAPASRASLALDVFANAQKLPSYSIHAQQRLLHQDQKQHQQAQHRTQSPTRSPSHQASELPLPLSASSSTSTQSSSRHYFQQQQPPSFSHTANSSDSQDTTSSASTDTDQLFTPPISEGELSFGGGGGSVNGSSSAYNPEHDISSQESQLHQLSRLAASRERMTDITESDAFDGGALSRKRAADGSVKHTRNASSTSPIYMGGHSRNTSTVSVASTTGGRIGEAHSIDQVENFASHAASPASSTSTIHGRHGSSLSPRIPGRPFHDRHQSQTSVSTLSTTIAPADRGLSTLDTSPWSSQQSSRSNHSTPPLPSPLGTSRSGSTAPTRSLAPPVSIQPSRPSALGRRNSNPGYTPPALPTFYSHQGSPHTPSTLDSGHVRTPTADPILYTPHQNVREQDAIETLLFMSSPGNSSNMKHFPPISSSQPLPAGHHDPQQYNNVMSPQRHGLPGSAPRKSLPTGRPNAPTYGSQPALGRRGGHHRSPSEMDLDEPYGTPYSRSNKGTPKRRANGAFDGTNVLSPRMKVPLSMPSGLSSTSKPRPALDEDDIEKMLDRAAAASADDSSDSESEILIPARRTTHLGV
ncbi:Nrm1 [Sporothrix schenckii 1099-18]|uniref:Nrm1 n=1 Tax=Sporothrix schenckii 1099-18 TaxID=1397361 RepID=A0A0F2MJH5_SPOSC|nr:Nrm1 [Sporothrix schenckii 1099-18]KJR88336.1 Nrm1 [Sporothrix schenckii 1099-18]